MKLLKTALNLVAIAAIPGMAAGQGLDDQGRRACVRDAIRLCSATMPDRARMKDCLLSKHDQVSEMCRSAITTLVKQQAEAKGREAARQDALKQEKAR